MDTELELQIARYLNGEMSADEAEDFEAEAQSDLYIGKELEIARLERQLLLFSTQPTLRDKMKEWDAEYKAEVLWKKNRRRRIYLIIMSVFLVTMLVFICKKYGEGLCLPGIAAVAGEKARDTARKDGRVMLYRTYRSIAKENEIEPSIQLPFLIVKNSIFTVSKASKTSVPIAGSTGSKLKLVPEIRKKSNLPPPSIRVAGNQNNCIKALLSENKGRVGNPEFLASYIEKYQETLKNLSSSPSDSWKAYLINKQYDLARKSLDSLIATKNYSI
jgi:hypothetical protein